MGLLQQWAMRAHEQGRRGRLIERVLADPDFERHALEIFQEQAVRQRESIREATTSDFPDLVGAQSQVERALIAQAALQTPTWRKYARIASLGDLKPVSRLRRSDTDRFGVVLEGAEAGQGNFSSYRVDYSPAKYELVLEFTWEMFVNDDLGAFQHIGHDLAQGAMNTVGDFVVGLLTSADPIYDGAPLFDGSRTNQSTDLLDVEGLQAGITAMRSQLSEKGHPLHIVPGYLVVPPELEFQAKTLVHSSLVPGGSTNDVNVLHGLVEVIVEPLLTRPEDWYLIAQPASSPTLELGFLNGRETPEVLVKEDFERDLLAYKGRLVLGGAILDWRSFYAGLPSLG
ncbi:MAG: hypothetical protein GEEBNDBF_01397 [bacterium]|nr:hypothetical protein [bacterium]